jgi:hypothetical protein
LCDALAQKVAKQFDHPERKQMLFHLLGREFVQHYFPKEQYDPLILVSFCQASGWLQFL